MCLSSMNFSKASIWVQIWGLPINDKIVNMCLKLGEKIEEFLEARIYEMRDRTMIVKDRNNLKIDSPIIPGIYIGSKKNGVNWIDFRYETLPMFCFYYG